VALGSNAIQFHPARGVLSTVSCSTQEPEHRESASIRDSQGCLGRQARLRLFELSALALSVKRDEGCHFLVAASKWALAFLPLARASEVYLSVLVEGIR
jgi:hypothetical protein